MQLGFKENPLDVRPNPLLVGLERQEEQLVHSSRLAELGEMAASIAHEINQPLTGIKNFAKNALYMIDTSIGSIEEIKENLERITEQVDRASTINDRSYTRLPCIYHARF